MRHDAGDKNVNDALELVDQGVLGILDNGVVMRLKRRKQNPHRRDTDWYSCAPKQVTTKCRGYLFFQWQSSGKTRSVRLNRLVYAYFKGPLHPGYEVHHNDNDKANNHPDNLAEVTHLENQRLAAVDGLYPNVDGERNPAAVVTAKDIEHVCELLEDGLSCTQAARKLGIGVNIIHNMVYNKTWQHLPCVQNLNYQIGTHYSKKYLFST